MNLPPWGELAVADAHVHFFSHRFFESLAGQAKQPVDDIGRKLAWQLPPEDPAALGLAWAAELDRQGVAQAALIASFPGDEASVAAAAAAAPGRFWPYAMLNCAAGRWAFDR